MPQDELVDIVDEKNQVLYRSQKSDAHAKGLLHRTILAEVRNQKGEWLLVKQAGDRQDAGQYVSPIGGHIRAGESEVEALEREAGEELGIAGFPYIYKGSQIWNRFIRGRQENHYFILYEIAWDGTVALNEESVGFRWFTATEIKILFQSDPKMFGDAWYFAVRAFYPKTFL
jgi:8-oxo-dGTP pyrophosphatase MutT (NUDIX family)